MNQPAKVLLITTEDQMAEFPLLENSHLKDPKLELITKQQIELYEKEGFVIPSNASEGTILLLNPFEPKRYVNVEDNFEIIKSKRELINEITSYLGIRKVAYEISLNEFKNEKRELKAKAKIKGWNMDLKIKNIKDEKISKDLISCEVYGAYSIDERKKLYSRAKELVQQYPTLQADEEIQRLLRQRDPEIPLKAGGKSYYFVMTSEVNEALDIAASIRYFDPKIFSIGINAQKEINTKTFFSFQYVCIWDEENADAILQKQYESITEKWMKMNNIPED